MKRSTILLAIFCAGLLLGAHPVGGQGDTVFGTVHNLSASGPGQIKSLTEREVCKFCHVPHSAVVPVPLWGHEVSKAQYRTPELGRGRPDARPSPQPDGSSRLCLSCHDGTVALGDLAGAGRQDIVMSGKQRFVPGDRGYLGLDLSGSHPVSFVVEPEPPGLDRDTDIGLNPLGAIRADPDVRLDSEGKMQCTSCHDPHADRFFVEGRVPRFWLKPTVDEVCSVCHHVR